MPAQQETGTDFISIAVADSTRIHTQLLAEAMHADHGLQVVASTSSSHDLLAAVIRVPIDVAVISYSLDDQPGRGTQVLREMRTLRPQIKGVLLLDSSQPNDILECFRAGAKGIFSKHERLESLCRCIRCVHEGQIWARSDELEHALEALANSPLVRATNHKGLELLSSRERQVVQYLAAGMTNREIADSLGLSRHTVKNYLFRIFDKLGVSSRTELLYRTMSTSTARAEPAFSEKGDGDFSVLLQAAESGHAWAQFRLAENYRTGNGHAPDPVAAYAWFLLSQRTTALLSQQIDASRADLHRAMTAEQIAEGERRAAEWLRGTRKTSASATPEKIKENVAGMNL